MRGKRRDYTEVGKRIAALARNQRELAAVLGINHTTVSRRLRGDCGTVLSDLEKLADHYSVPLTHFFDEPADPPELAACWERLRQGPSEAQELVLLAARLPEADVRKLVEIVKALPADLGCSREQAPPPAP